MVDAFDSKSNIARCESSSLSLGTYKRKCHSSILRGYFLYTVFDEGETRTGKGVGKTGLVFPWRKNGNRGVPKPRMSDSE